MPSCASINCTSRSVKGCGKTFHAFPRSRPNIMKQWLVNMKRANYVPSKSAVLCSDHFEDFCFDKTGQTTRLRYYAVPTVFKFTKDMKKERKRKRLADCATTDSKSITPTAPSVPSAAEGDSPTPSVPLAAEGDSPTPSVPSAAERDVLTPSRPSAAEGNSPTPSVPSAAERDVPTPSRPSAAEGDSPTPSVPSAVEGDTPTPSVPLAAERDMPTPSVLSAAEGDAPTPSVPPIVTQAISTSSVKSTATEVVPKDVPSMSTPSIPSTGVHSVPAFPLSLPSSTVVATTAHFNNLQDTIPFTPTTKPPKQQDHDYDISDSPWTLKRKLNSAVVKIEEVKKKLKHTQQQNRRLEKKATNLESAIMDLKNERAVSPIEMLQGSLTDVHLKLLERIMNNTKRTITREEFPPDICRFALDLQSCSMKAYNYVRDSLGFVLPHPSTIRRWHSEGNERPGSTNEANEVNNGSSLSLEETNEENDGTSHPTEEVIMANTETCSMEEVIEVNNGVTHSTEEVIEVNNGMTHSTEEVIGTFEVKASDVEAINAPPDDKSSLPQDEHTVPGISYSVMEDVGGTCFHILNSHMYDCTPDNNHTFTLITTG